MKEKVRKFFMAGTDEEVQLGDVISVDLEKDFGDGRKLTREMEFKLTEDTQSLAIETGIIEAQEDENEENDLIDFGNETDLQEVIADLIDDQISLEKRVGILEEQVLTLKSLLEAETKQKKTASPKKK